MSYGAEQDIFQKDLRVIESTLKSKKFIQDQDTIIQKLMEEIEMLKKNQK